MGRALVLSSLLFTCAIAVRADCARPAPAAAPQTMLWAWERAEDLRFIDPARVGVAYLAESIYLDASGLRRRPRVQPMQVPPGTQVVAVTRVDRSIDRSDLPISLVAPAARVIARTARESVSGVQIDFDARESDRDFYRALIRAVRAELPPAKELTITALASWCLGDRWIDDLPIDDAIPMLFRMGTDGAAVLRGLSEARDFRSPLCRRTLGLSIDEPGPAALPTGRRLFVFSPRSWTPSMLTSFEAERRR